MKTRLLRGPQDKRRMTEAGSALLVGILVTGLLAGLLGVYLTLVKSQNAATGRSQAWNAAVPILEAGLEEGLEHLASNGASDLGVDGWTLRNGYYVMQRNVGDGFFIVGISNGAQPVVISQAYVELTQIASAPSSGTMVADVSGTLSQGYLGRGVRVTTSGSGLFAKGLVAKGQINMNGNNIATDSFDPADPNFSTNGQYDAAKRKDHGDVATNSGLTNSLSVGNADIYGHVATGPGGSVSIGPNGAVGDAAWHSAGNSGIKAGYSTDDMNVSFPDVVAPFSGGAWTPGGGTVNGTSYTYVLNAGNYQLPSLSMSGKNKLIVTGDATLYITGNVSMSGQSYIQVATNAVFKLYVGGSSASLGGQGVINQSGSATNFVYYGLPSNTSVSMSGNAEFKGILYAPSAALSLSGGGSGDNDFIGASVSSTVTMNGHFKFHYDETLANYGPNRGYVVTSWNEMSPGELAALEQSIDLNAH